MVSGRDTDTHTGSGKTALAPDEAADAGRSARKRQAILDAAATIFLRQGYLGTSMDEIAARAGVSKQTVYKHFADKERLFVEIVVATVDEISDPVHEEVLQLLDSSRPALERDLRELARRLLARVLQPRVVELRRLVIGEASRFPDLGRAFYERGPGRTIDALAQAFEGLAARGVLRVEDAHLAAAHFNWLVMSVPINAAMFLGEDAVPPAAEMRRIVDGAVRAFVAAYGNG
jgi:TetR/AcrR family transcriptional regulator, mexJK operon transcriptional repressor